MATERHRRNAITSLQLADGQMVELHDEKADFLFKTYKQRLGETDNHSMLFDLAQLIMKVDGLEVLSAPFTKQEIDNALKNIPIDKAPGPDGFNGCFLRTCCDIIANDFYNIFRDLQEGKIDLLSLNGSLLTLIPKKLNPLSPNDYRPISLLNCCLKLMKKVIADRL